MDFWWMDWQQGTDYHCIHKPNAPGEYKHPSERMDPLWLLNHLHILDIFRNGKRPMFFSRYASPGIHRYPVVFSGDTSVNWESLQFPPILLLKFPTSAMVGGSTISMDTWARRMSGCPMENVSYSKAEKTASKILMCQHKCKWRNAVSADQLNNS